MGAFLTIAGLRFSRSWKVMFALSALATGFAAVWWKYDVLSIHDDERNAYDDGLKKFTGTPVAPITRSEDIVLVAIDDKTFDDVAGNAGWRTRYGGWPYDRVIYADVFTYLKNAGAKGILFDAVIDEPKPDPTGDLAMGEAIRDEAIPVWIGFKAAVTSRSLPKVEAVNRPIPVKPLTPIVAPAVVDAGSGPEEFPSDESFPEETFPEEGAAVADAGYAEAAAAKLLAGAQAMAFPVTATDGLEIPVFAPEEERDEKGARTGKQLALNPAPPIAQLVDTVAGIGTVAVEEDEDGKMRRTAFAISDGTNNYVTLPLALFADVVGAKSVEISPGVLTVGSEQIPINADGTAELNYGGKMHDRFRSVSMVDVLRLLGEAKDGAITEQGKALFGGKYVVVGNISLGGGDIKATPYASLEPGVMKQATTLDNLLHKRFILQAPFWVSLLFAFLVAFFSTALVMVVRNSFVDIGWPVLLYVGFFLVTGLVLVKTNVHVLSALPGLAGTLASVLATSWERLFAGKDRENLKTLFQNFMEPGMVDQLIEGKELPTLEGESRVVTAFFSDIRGFSTFSEKYRSDPKGLMKILNRYLSAVTPVLFQHGGCIDKYIGDAVVCLYGAPARQPDHALRACRAALAVQEAIAKLREDFRKEGLPDVYTRVGLNTDEMFVGNIGSDQLLDYTAIGDGMNLAARLEAANKEYGTLIMIGEGTFKMVRNHVEARELDWIRVAGKTRQSTVYELVAMKDHAPPERLQLMRYYAEALALYRARNFSDALKPLTRALAIDPKDGPSVRLHERCEKYMFQSVEADWDAVSELSK